MAYQRYVKLDRRERVLPASTPDRRVSRLAKIRRTHFKDGEVRIILDTLPGEPGKALPPLPAGVYDEAVIQRPKEDPKKKTGIFARLFG